MVRVDAETRIERPATTVFDFVVIHFFENYPRWSPEVQTLEPLSGGGLAPGDRARQIRVDRGRRSDTVFEVSTLEPERRVRFECVEGPAFAIEYGFEPIDTDRCHLTFTFELLRLELYMRPFQGLIRRTVRDSSTQAVARIKQLVEDER